jgi:hypothetical protein
MSHQEVLWVLQATIEAELGAGFCPAYRDTAYIVFEDLPLGKLGNRPPQVIVEATNNSTPGVPVETRTGAATGSRRTGSTTPP